MPPHNTPVHVSPEWESDILGKVADGAMNGVSGKEHEEGRKRIVRCWSKLMKTEEFDELKDEGVKYAKKESEKGVDGITIIGRLARWLYNAAEEALSDALDEIKESKDLASKILKGILFGLCLIVAVIVVVSLGLVALALAIIAIAVEGVWKVIRSVTKWSWDAFTNALKYPGLWVAIVAIGGGVAFANPLIGGIIAAVGGIGIAVTTVVRAVE